MKRLTTIQTAIRTSALLGILAFGPRLAFSTTYYVSCAGSDSNNGTSSSTPWTTYFTVP